MCDEQKKAYTANWITIIDNKSFVAGINSQPLYLTESEAQPLLALCAITEFIESNYIGNYQ
ncbi:hypothetical protein [Thalassotalea sp. G2M2-11]|uniref:hypothetical protein n=1 Tax=Thalassotalea sp. G2M2-11 TaxID=2787627 RepID=UPI0019D161EE|nr:hypothetical protein [Thalassotalea sp. G2M2-11]